MAIREHLTVPCPVCRSPRGHRCRTLKTKRSTDTHTDRVIDAARARHDQATTGRHLTVVR